MHSGDSQDRSSENTTAITLPVPTLAPCITDSAAMSEIMPSPTKADTISAVAVLDCTTAVTPTPERMASSCVRTPRAISWRQIGAKDAQYAGAHHLNAPDEQGNGGQQIE